MTNSYDELFFNRIILAGVVLTFSNLINQMESLIDCWQLTANDCVLHVLPLNHVHGLIYSLLTPFYMGAQVEMVPKFEADNVWLKLIDKNNCINIMTAVPTIYVKLLEFHKQNTQFKAVFNRINLTQLLRNKMRIMASASAPLNTNTFNNWFNLTGYRLVERYGLSETGLCLSNSCEETGVVKRIPGTVGRPFGNVKVRICELDEELKPTETSLVESDDKNDQILTENQTIMGELQVSGPMVFKEYLNKSEQTRDAFTSDHWFKTGTDKFIYVLFT